jgi:hypothetical protein
MTENALCRDGCVTRGRGGPDDPAPTDPISIERSEFDAAYDRPAAGGVPMKPDRDRCWRDFAGWRVNYDAALIGVAGPAHLGAAGALVV